MRPILRGTSHAQWWTGAESPEHITDLAAQFGPLRGDEVFTEEVATALARREERCFVVVKTDASTASDTVAVVVEDRRGETRRWTVETAAPSDVPALHHDLVRVIAAHDRCPSLVFWRPPTTSPHRGFAFPLGSRVDRTIVEMHAHLPLVESASKRPVPLVECRPLCSVADDVTFIDTIVRINNAAFADHPEQGELSRSLFEARTAAPWFDPHGLSIATVDGRDVGFVWMKCMQGRPAELYVVAVDPTCSVPGLGRALVHRGFDHANRAHGSTHAMLFVDAANERAVGLYRSLGFRAVRRQDVVRIKREQ